MIIDKVNSKIIRKLKEHEWLKLRQQTKIKKNQMFFESFSASSFQGNIFYLFKYYFLDVKFCNYKFIIASKSPEQLVIFLKKRELYDERVMIVEYLSHQYIAELYSSKYLYNNVTFPMLFVKKEMQIYVNTWHGTPLKCIGKRAGTNALIVQNMQRDFLACDYLLSPNSMTTEIYNKDFNVRNLLSNGIQEIGYPRNEIFYDEEYRKSERKRQGFEGKKVIFYLPTWRSNEGKNIDFIQLMEQLAMKIGDEYLIYIKLHPLDISDKSQLKRVCYMPDEYEVYEFLQCCDILITDYSSVFFDFANTSRPIILYQFDQKEYYGSRGIYREIEQMITLPIATDLDELASMIKKSYPENLNLKDVFCPYDACHPIEKLNGLIFRLEANVESVVCNLVIVTNENFNPDYLHINDLKYKTLFFLIPQKSNHFFRKQDKLLDIDFVVGSAKGQYSFIEKSAIALRNVISNYKLEEIVQNAYNRERSRILGNLQINKVYYSNDLPDYLKEFQKEKI